MAKSNCPACDQPWNKKQCEICGYEAPPPEPKAPKEKKPKEPKPPKVEKTELELVEQYANIIISKSKTRNTVKKEFQDIVTQTPSKDLWQEKEFYFSVVFQSTSQKMKFLEFLSEKFGITTAFEGNYTPMIVNGLVMAEKMGLELKPEFSEDYPTDNMQLRDFILDEERR